MHPANASAAKRAAQAMRRRIGNDLALFPPAEEGDSRFFKRLKFRNVILGDRTLILAYHVDCTRLGEKGGNLGQLFLFDVGQNADVALGYARVV